MELEPAVEKRFRHIEAILWETAEGQQQAKLRMDIPHKKLKATRELGKAVVRARLNAILASKRADRSKL